MVQLMGNYLDKVRTQVVPISAFGNGLVDELDLQNGGFPCMHGHTDSKRLVLIADYLIQSLIGVASALEDAALAAQRHQENVTADDYWMNAQSRAVARQNPTASTDEFLKALQRGQREERRDREIGTSAAHAFIHMTQALDRTAAAIAIIGALDMDVLRVGWSDLEKAAREAKPPKRPFHAVSDEGHAIQRELLELTASWRDFGPADWLPGSLRHATPVHIEHQ